MKVSMEELVINTSLNYYNWQENAVNTIRKIYLAANNSIWWPSRTTENHPILNHMYDILTELHNQGKRSKLCEVPAHTGVKANEADKTEKQAIDMPRMTTTKPPYTDYYLTI